MVVAKLDLCLAKSSDVEGSLVVSGTCFGVGEGVLHEHTVDERGLGISRRGILVVGWNYGRVVVGEVVGDVLRVDYHTLHEVVA